MATENGHSSCHEYLFRGRPSECFWVNVVMGTIIFSQKIAEFIADRLLPSERLTGRVLAIIHSVK
jgi:hypothetical protein